MESLQETFVQFLEGDSLYPALGGGILLLALFFIVLRRQPRELHAFDGPHGSVMVARSAIGELVQRVADHMDSVGRCSTHIRTRGKSLSVTVRIKLLVGTRLNDVSTELQTRLSRNLRENLGIEKLGPIDIVVGGYVGNIEATSADEGRLTEPTRPAEEYAYRPADASPVVEDDDSSSSHGPDDERRDSSGAT